MRTSHRSRLTSDLLYLMGTRPQMYLAWIFSCFWSSTTLETHKGKLSAPACIMCINPTNRMRGLDEARRREASVKRSRPEVGRSIYMLLILKSIGNRKGDCAWSCSRWQTQPEKICKSQCTNQCHSLRTLYWFVLCTLQIFSGCVCHLEQLHAQPPFLFPKVFSINLIPFFDICSVLQ